ncbi:hypothetical protein PENTCL1PPCAC_10756, partial [Pristionchus entomophagus]
RQDKFDLPRLTMENSPAKRTREPATELTKDCGTCVNDWALLPIIINPAEKKEEVRSHPKEEQSSII